MEFSALDLCSQALVKVGASPIHSFETNMAEARVARAFYETTKQNLLSCFPWTFATKNMRLAQMSDSPISDYIYAYALPHDFLRVLSAGNGTQSAGLTYHIKGTQLHTNSAEVYLTYISNVAETDFPPFFRQALTTRLSSEFCLPLTENTGLAEFLNDQAEKDEKKARLIDSQQETTRAILNFPMINVRR